MRSFPGVIALILAAGSLAGCQGTFQSAYQPAPHAPVAATPSSDENVQVVWAGMLAPAVDDWKAHGYVVLGSSSFWETDPVDQPSNRAEAAQEAAKVGATLVVLNLTPRPRFEITPSSSIVSHHGVTYGAGPPPKSKITAVFLRKAG